MKKLSDDQILRFLLYAGAVYFLLVALLHSLGIKIPGFYVYYNVPSHAYQDRIISFLALGWSGFFLLAARKMERDLIRFILILGLVALIALWVNTLISNFQQLDETIIRSDFYWILIVLFFYWLGLVFHARHYFYKTS